MDLKRLDFSLKTIFCLLVVFAVNAYGQTLCTAPVSVNILENNDIDVVVTSLTLEEGVSVTLTDNPENAFRIDGNQLVATKSLDFEALSNPALPVGLQCSKAGASSESKTVFVVVENVNDNPPVFTQSVYNLQLEELSSIGTTVGKVEATDADKDQLYFWLDPTADEFEVMLISGEIVVKKILDYDTTKTVNLNVFTGPLTLQPGPVRAIDGDNGRNEEINYRILGADGGAFQINQNTGEITMREPVGEAGSVVLTVMAYEVQKPDQFATTPVTVEVLITSVHPPKFEKSSYEGFISEDADLGSLVLESKTQNKPLKVGAIDEDFTNGVNPDIVFETPAGSLFTITQEGFILMTSQAPAGPIDLIIRVVDKITDESGEASLLVEVTPGVPTTTTEMSTTPISTSTITTDMTTGTARTTDMTTGTTITTDMTTGTARTTDMTTGTARTTDMTTGTGVTTDVVTSIAVTTGMVTQLTITTSPIPTPSPQTDKVLGPGGEFKAEDMAALGACLAVVLLICLVVIGLLVFRIKRHNADWKKLSEASVFRSTLSGGSSGPKDGVQYTNEGFQNGGDTGSVSSKQAAELPLPLAPVLTRSMPQQQEKQSSAPSLQSSAPPADSISLSASEDADNEKEVKPILTKERRVEDGYKAVWFKQDIHPDIKEEVVIIPDSRDRDASHEDDEDDDDDDDEREEEEEEEEDTNMTTERMGSDDDDDDEDEDYLTSDL
ncbi:hypothetical protein NFI96_015693 [Prochilodus magdalenae]|nr:hypothetical protein NFI96_015693 [Prochilodus magdalenae]